MASFSFKSKSLDIFVFLFANLWNNNRLISAFRRSLFEACPQVKVLFGFPIDVDPTSDDVRKSKRFLMHASYMIQMLDTALNMLGPDIELLTEIMAELGEKHVRYGVKPEYFPKMGDALYFTLKETLKDGWTDATKDAWEKTYGALSQDMIKAQLKAKRKSSGGN